MAGAPKETSVRCVVCRSGGCRRGYRKDRFSRLPTRRDIRGDCFGGLWLRHLALAAIEKIGSLAC